MLQPRWQSSMFLYRPQGRRTSLSLYPTTYAAYSRRLMPTHEVRQAVRCHGNNYEMVATGQTWGYVGEILDPPEATGRCQ